MFDNKYPFCFMLSILSYRYLISKVYGFYYAHEQLGQEISLSYLHSNNFYLYSTNIKNEF
jgi:hypothetical protein